MTTPLPEGNLPVGNNRAELEPEVPAEVEAQINDQLTKPTSQSNDTVYSQRSKLIF